MNKLIINEDGSNSFFKNGKAIKFNMLSYKKSEMKEGYIDVNIDGEEYKNVTLVNRNLEKFRMSEYEITEQRERDSINQVASPTKVKITKTERQSD